jgi:hypothetical protein
LIKAVAHPKCSADLPDPLKNFGTCLDGGAGILPARLNGTHVTGWTKSWEYGQTKCLPHRRVWGDLPGMGFFNVPLLLRAT